MPLTMKIQPIDCNSREEISQPVPKSLLKRLFERRSTVEKVVGAALEAPRPLGRQGSDELEPSSVCLTKMVQNFIEDNNSEKQRCGRNRCNCFNGNSSDSSDDDWDLFGGEFGCLKPPPGEACEVLKSLVLCTSVYERNLLADTTKIVEKNKICKRKDDLCRKIVTHGLKALGYDALICKSRWEKSSSYPAGEYQYIDVIIKGERLLIDIDFRSEFEIARPTKPYKTILQTVPYIFVGKADRLQKIILLVSEAAKQSLKKTGMHIPPWRKAEYIKAKWLSPHVRANQNPTSRDSSAGIGKKQPLAKAIEEEELELDETVFDLSENSEEEASAVKNSRPPQVMARSLQSGIKTTLGSTLAVDDPEAFQPLN